MERRRSCRRSAQDEIGKLTVWRALKTRLQKYLAEAGIGSRRGCEAVILAGRVAVNGQIADRLGACVEPGEDRVTVDGRPVHLRRPLHVALHKPPGYTCSRSRQGEGRQRLVSDLLPAEWSNLYPVGRLDRDSQGLLFLTNDGEFCLRLTHPRFGVEKQYVAVVAGRVEPATLDRLREGVRDGGDLLRATDARLVSANATRSRVRLTLCEGRNREVRRMFGSLGFEVLELTRIRIGPIRLGELPVGRYRVLVAAEVTALFEAAQCPAAARHVPRREGRQGR